MAHCRTCGKDVAENAVACPSCGVKPNDGKAFCQSCGKETNDKAIICTSCGVQLASAGSGFSVGEVGSGGPNPNPASGGEAILWYLCCFPIGYGKFGQGSKGWAWFGITLITGGFAGIAVLVDYIMSYNAQQTRTLGEWEFFPK